MNKRGFTLIELLAVIVILAIIALIATPIVLNIISNTKENAQLRSAEMYLDAVEQAVMREKMENTSFKPNTCKIEDKKLYCNESEEELKVEVDGEKPDSGEITFTEGKIDEVTLTYTNGKTIIKNAGELVYRESDTEQEEPVVLAAGLYDADGNMTKTWEQLIADGDLVVEDGVLRGGLDFASLNYYTDIQGKLVIDNSVTSIKTKGFGNISSLTTSKGLTEIVIPNSVTSIGGDAFKGCTSLKQVIISDSVTSIGEQAFAECSILTTIYYSGTATGAPWGATNATVVAE